MCAFRSHLLHGCTALVLFAQTAWSQASVNARDTLNQMDVYGRKQGWWQVMAPKPEKPDYRPGQLIEEGRYADSKRIGRWKRYWPNGKVMSEINYDLGRPRGEYRIYYPSGKLEEHGNWDIDRNTGGFKRWHPNGQVSQDFVFDQNGTRNGLQRYYHENGQVEVEVQIKDGREEGTLKRYYANGDLQQVAQFNNGVINEANSKYIRSVKKPVPEPVDPAAKPAPARTGEEVTNAVVFRENGYNTLYDKQLRITQQGEFKGGQLWNGKVYRYDAAGLLFRVEIYREGRYAGNGVIEEADRR